MKEKYVKMEKIKIQPFSIGIHTQQNQHTKIISARMNEPYPSQYTDISI